MPSDDISTLQNVFPNIPHDIIETILESNLGDVDKAFDNLLEMSDPDFGHQTNNASDRSSTAPPALPRPRVSFQEPERTNVQVYTMPHFYHLSVYKRVLKPFVFVPSQSTINHWSADVSMRLCAVRSCYYVGYLFTQLLYNSQMRIADLRRKKRTRLKRTPNLQEDLQPRNNNQGLHNRHIQHQLLQTLLGQTLECNPRLFLVLRLPHVPILIPTVLHVSQP